MSAIYFLPLLFPTVSPIDNLDSVPPVIQRIYEEFQWEGLARGVDFRQAKEDWEIRFGELGGLKRPNVKPEAKELLPLIPLNGTAWMKSSEEVYSFMNLVIAS